MVPHDRFTDLRRPPSTIPDRRRSNTTSCAACANGWLVDHRRTDYPLSGNLQPRGQLKTALTKPLQERRRNRQAEGLGGLEVEDQIELCRLLDGEVCRVGALENLVDVSGGAMPWPRSS